MDRESTKKEIEDLLKQYPEDIRKLAMTLHDEIRRMEPYIVEKVYPGWKVILCSFDGTLKKGICALSPQKEHVKIVFYRGSELDDPEGLLTGDGKKVRHIKITEPEEFRNPGVKTLIKQAAGLAETPGVG